MDGPELPRGHAFELLELADEISVVVVAGFIGHDGDGNLRVHQEGAGLAYPKMSQIRAQRHAHVPLEEPMKAGDADVTSRSEICHGNFFPVVGV
jgi:hypothetical protein